MPMKKEILAIIPARGGSKGIPRKNIHLVAGKPLLWYTANAALKSKYISRCVLSTEDEEIAELGEKLGLEVPFLRSEKLARDDTPGIDVIQSVVEELHRIDDYSPDTILILQPTSPLRRWTHIDEAIELYLDGDADSLVSVVDVPHQYNPYSVMQLNGEYIKAFLSYPERDNLRQKKPQFYARNGAAIYLIDRVILMDKGTLFGDKLLPYLMNKTESIDIDDYTDLEIAEFFLEKINRTSVG